MRFLLWKEGSGKQDLRVVEGWSFLCQVFERKLLVLTQVLRWRGWGEWTLLHPVIPAIMEVKGCSKWNRWHFCENIGTAWNGVRPALRCLDIVCLCIPSFLLKDFSQTEQNQLMPTPQEQNVDWERGRMLRIYIGFQATKFYCFPPPPPPPPHFYCFSSSSSSSSFYCFLSFAHSFHFFFSTRFYKRLPTAIFSSFWSNVSCSKQQSWFSSAVSWLPCLSAPVSFKDSYSKTTACTSLSLIQCTYGTHSHPRRK